VRLAGGQLLSGLLTLIIVGVTASGLFGEHGVAHLLRLRRERQDVGRATFTLLEENRRLRREIARVKTDDVYLEGLARRHLGLVRPNETVYRFPQARRETR
jgi:cell division protein FtsB